MKDEQMRKLALLAEQYEKSVLELNQKQSVSASRQFNFCNLVVEIYCEKKIVKFTYCFLISVKQSKIFRQAFMKFQRRS